MFDRDEERSISLRVGEQHRQRKGRREHQEEQDQRAPGDGAHAGSLGRAGHLRGARHLWQELVEIEWFADDIRRADGLGVTREIVRG